MPATATNKSEQERMRIVVGYDGSESAKRALQRAADLAGSGDRIVVVAAAEPRATTAIEAGAHLDPSEFQQRRGDLEEARRLLSERGIDERPGSEPPWTALRRRSVVSVTPAR